MVTFATMETITNSLATVGTNANVTMATDVRHYSAMPADLLVILACLLSVLIVASVVGNGLVLYVIATRLRCTSYTNAFIASLSASDLLTSSLCMTTTLASLLHPQPTIYNNLLCNANGLLNGTFSIASTWMLACIAVDRCHVLGKVPRAGPGARTAFLAIVLCWSAGVLFSFPWYILPPGGGGGRLQVVAFHKAGFQHCMYLFHVVGSNEGATYAALVIAVCYAAPVLTMLSCCSRLWAIIRQTEGKILPVSVQPAQIRFSAELRTARSVLIMVLLYILTRGPYLVMGISTALTGGEMTVAMDTTALWLFWSNCALNPVVYAVRNPTFADFLRVKRQTAYRARSFTDIEAMGCYNGFQIHRDKNGSLQARNGDGPSRGSLSTARGSLESSSMQEVFKARSLPTFTVHSLQKEASVVSSLTSATTLATTTVV